MGAVAASRPTMRWRGELQGATGPSAAAAATAERDSQEISLLGSFRELSSDWELPSDSGISQEIEVGVELTSISRRANRKGDTVRLLPSTSPDSSEFSGHSRIDWDDPVATHKILSRVRSHLARENSESGAQIQIVSQVAPATELQLADMLSPHVEQPVAAEADLTRALAKLRPSLSAVLRMNGASEEMSRTPSWASGSLACSARPIDSFSGVLRNLHDLDCAALAVLLTPTRLSALTKIDLSYNKLGDGGAMALGRALSGGAPRLTKLWLHENSIGSVGFAALSDAMRLGGVPAIEEVRIQHNCVGDQGATSLARAWAAGGCRALREVHARANKIGSVGLNALARELHQVPNLVLLYLGGPLGGNLVSDEGADTLAAALRMNTGRSITVHLANNPHISSSAAERLLQAARDCGPSIKVVC